MGKNQSASGLTNVIQYNNNGITFVSASTTLGTLNSSGSLSVTQNITGSNILATGNIVAQTLVVQTVTSSINYSSGSNIFGNQLTNTQQFTGSVRVTGSLTVATTNPELTVGATGVTLGNVLTDVHQVTGSLRVTGSVAIGTTSPLSVLDARAASATMGNYQTIQAFSTDSTGINLGAGISLGGNYISTTSIAQFASIVGRKENATSGNYDGYLAFGTNAQATGVVERMRITSGGNVLIGGTVVQNIAANRGNLTINGTTSILNLSTSDTNAGYLYHGGTDMLLVNAKNGATLFYTSDTERMRITGGAAAGGNLKLSGTSISSFTSNPGNVAASGTTTLVISQISGQFQSTYLVTINGLYTSAGANQNGYGSALVNFFTDGSVAQANATQLQGNGWSITASATTGGTFTITFTNSASTTMSNIAIRALKLNMTGGD